MFSRTFRCLTFVAVTVAVVIGSAMVSGAAAQRAPGAAQNTRAVGKSLGPACPPVSEAEPCGRVRLGGCWRPRISAIAPDVTAADRNLAEARLAEYERLFTVPESIARPQGFEARPTVSGGLEDARRSVPHFQYGRFEYGISLLDMSVQTERSTSLWARENVGARSVWIVDSGPPHFKDSEGEYYQERPRSGPLPGMPGNAVVFGGLNLDRTDQARENVIQVLLTSDGELPWSDVSRERVLNSFIAQAERDRQAAQQTLSDARKVNRQGREQMLAAVAAASGQAEAAKVKAELEKADREAAEYQKEYEAQLTQSIASVTAEVARLRDQLRVMSPAERAEPAWIALGHDG